MFCIRKLLPELNVCIAGDREPTERFHGLYHFFDGNVLKIIEMWDLFYLFIYLKLNLETLSYVI